MSHIPDAWTKALAVFADPIGLPQDQARMILSLFAAIPLGLLHSVLPPLPLLKHFYSFTVGFFIAWFVVGNGAFHVLLASLLVYGLAYALPRRWMPHVLTGGLVAYLSYAHLYRMWYHYLGWEMDVSLIMMIFVVKASTFAFNWADGQALAAHESLHPKPHLHHHRAVRALRTFPDPLSYLSYIWYFGGVLVGPCFEMKEYLDFTDGSLFRHLGLSSIPPTLGPALWQVGIAALCYPFVYVHSMYPIIGFVNTPAYAALPLLQRLLYFWVTITCSRFKYYFAWYLSAAGCISSGLGLSGVQRAPVTDHITGYEWERCRNVDVVQCELATSMPQLTNAWNMGVNNWLKHYVYFRIDPPPSISRVVPTKSLANVVTKLTSAFWHGFYPAYYFFFLGAFGVNEMDEALRSRLLPLMDPQAEGRGGKEKGTRSVGGAVYGVLAWLLLFACMNNLGMAFMLLKAEWSLQFWGSFYYFVFWMPLIVIALCRLLPRPPRRKAEGGKEPADAAPAVKSDKKRSQKEL